MSAQKKSTKATQDQRPLRGSLRATWLMYSGRIVSILIATIFPLALIVMLRWLSDDYTGDQYAAVIGLISIFNTLLLARLVTVGWNRTEVKLIPYYNAVMSRYLSGIGLIAMLGVYSLPLLAGTLLIGLTLVGQLAAGWLALTLPLLIVGLGVMLHASFASFAFMDDMSLTVWQSLRISGRLARYGYRSLIARVAGAVGVAVLFGALVIWVGSLSSSFLQSPQTQLFVDAILSWLITPALFCYGATVYQMLLEAYE